MWLDLETLFLHPERIEPLADELAARLKTYDAEVVCGPLIEGAFVGLMVAQKLGLPFTYSERYERSRTRSLYRFGYRVPHSLHRPLEGRRVAIVNDVISAGSAVGGTWESLDVLGAKPIVIGALLVLGDWTSRFAAQK
jgi:orotate phosphoribosyltransferase